MDKAEINKLDMQSKDIVSDNINKISELFPNCISEGKIDFDMLKQELTKDIIEEGKEKYQLTWAGKKESIVNANKEITKTLRPVKEKSVNFDKTKNIYIEGDNLDALKILQESYLNKIKCIYIDPPYNTGNDFIYNDKFISENELEDSGQIDEYNNKLITNTDSNGKFHSDWLSMMYSRLKLSRNLLTDDGVIFISIDDNEVMNLRKICDEIFGENNFISELIWKSKSGGANDSKNIAIDHEYILCYSKKNESVKILLDKNAEATTSYNNVDENGKRYSLERLDKQSLGYMESLDFPIVAPDGKEYVVEHKNPNNKVARWRWGKDTVKERYNELVFKWPYVYTKNYEKEGGLPRSLLVDERFGRTRTGKKDLKDLFDDVSIFTFPKPVNLIKYLISIVVKENDIIMDYFSGSATTAQAVIENNIENNLSNRFILVQLPEKIDNLEYHTICDFGEERIKRYSTKILNENVDNGFRVYKVDTSNMKDVYYVPTDLQQSQLDMFESNIKDDRTSEDLLTQVILDLGLTLDLSIEEKKIINNNVYFVESNSLVACFDDVIDINIIDEICKSNPLKIVFKESSFKTDNDKINTFERIKKMSPETEVNII